MARNYPANVALTPTAYQLGKAIALYAQDRAIGLELSSISRTFTAAIAYLASAIALMQNDPQLARLLLSPQYRVLLARAGIPLGELEALAGQPDPPLAPGPDV